MGTNYYAHLNTCPHCHRPEKILHIGKSSYGWKFIFQGYDRFSFSEDDKEVGEDIKSILDWLMVLSYQNTKIEDEYGNELSLKEIQEKIEHINLGENTKNHFDVYGNGVNTADLWKDSLGYAFIGREFS